MRLHLFAALVLASCSRAPGQDGSNAVSAAASDRVHDIAGLRLRLERVSSSGERESRMYRVSHPGRGADLGILTAKCDGRELVGASFEPVNNAEGTAASKAATHDLCL